MKRILAALIFVLIGSAHADSCIPPTDGGCTGDVIHVNDSLNIQFGAVSYQAYWKFWNKTSCTLKAFKYQITYDADVYDNDGNTVVGSKTDTYKLNVDLPPHQWTEARDVFENKRSSFSGTPKTSNVQIVILSPLECVKAEEQPTGAAAPAAVPEECCFVLRNGKMVKVPSPGNSQSQ